MNAPVAIRLQESALQAEQAVLNQILPSGEPYLLHFKQGQTLRIVDLEGNQAVDVIFYNAQDLAEHYSATDTMLAQGGIYLTTGSVLMSSEGRPMLTIVADTCGRHDTLGGACAAESNTVRYALQKKFMHSCRDNYLIALQHADLGLLHERARHRRRPAHLCRWRLGPWQVCGAARRDGHLDAGLQLPAAQQPLQRLQPHARPIPLVGLTDV